MISPLVSLAYRTAGKGGERRELLESHLEFSNHKHLCNSIKNFFLGLSAFFLPRTPVHADTHFLFFFFLWTHLQHMEVLVLGVELELRLQAYATTIPLQDLSHIWELGSIVQQRQILNPWSKARDWTYILIDTSKPTDLQWELHIFFF